MRAGIGSSPEEDKQVQKIDGFSVICTISSQSVTQCKLVQVHQPDV